MGNALQRRRAGPFKSRHATNQFIAEAEVMLSDGHRRQGTKLIFYSLQRKMMVTRDFAAANWPGREYVVARLGSSCRFPCIVIFSTTIPVTQRKKNSRVLATVPEKVKVRSHVEMQVVLEDNSLDRVA